MLLFGLSLPPVSLWANARRRGLGGGILAFACKSTKLRQQFRSKMIYAKFIIREKGLNRLGPIPSATTL